jgi:DNA-binding transcriptional LysR family regulator
VTFAQLRSFATVARLGSVTAAASELGVSEPAVSSAIATLRREFGDELIVRGGGGVRLTAGGARLAAAANEILGLADRARRSVGEANGASESLPVAVNAEVAEFAAAPLLDAFTRRAPRVEATLQVEEPGAFAELLYDHVIDVALGPRPLPDPRRFVESVPFLRYRMVVVAAPGHRLAGRDALAPSALADERWLVGPDGVQPGSPTAQYFGRARIAPGDVRAFPSDAAALSAAAAGEGVMLALWHAAAAALRRRAIVRLAVRGTPVVDLWHASTLPDEHCLTTAAALRRFTTSADATQAMAAPRRGVPATIVRAPVHATLWHSVARPAGS